MRLQPERDFAGGLAGNLLGGFAFWFFLPRAWRLVRASGSQLLGLFLLDLTLGVAYDFYAVGTGAGRFDPLALPAVSFWALPALAAAWWIAGLLDERTGKPGNSGARRGFLPLATAAFALSCIESLAASALAVAADAIPAIDRRYDTLSWAPLLWLSLAYAVAAVRAPGSASAMAIATAEGSEDGMPRHPPVALSPWRRTAVFALAFGLTLAPQWAIDPGAQLWNAPPDADTAQAEDTQSEQTLYSQFDLLDEALAAVTPAQGGGTQLYTISFAGDGTQDVFLHEATAADAIMADVFDTSGHDIVLANSRVHPDRYPFATASSLERAIDTMADKMNLDNDVLAIFLTSHGSPDHRLVVSLPPYQFDDITPQALRSMLDEAGIRYRVIIVSACYSGAFVAPLETPDTMVITASAADRSSFGCRDGARWTDFGRAFFADALARDESFEDAFRTATKTIAAREAREHEVPSQPQIFIGSGIRERLRTLQPHRGGSSFADT